MCTCTLESNKTCSNLHCAIAYIQILKTSTHADILIRRVSHVQEVLPVLFGLRLLLRSVEAAYWKCTLLSALLWAPNSGLRCNHTWALLLTLLVSILFMWCESNGLLTVILWFETTQYVICELLVLRVVFCCCFLINIVFFKIWNIDSSFSFVCLLYVHSLLC